MIRFRSKVDTWLVLLVVAAAIAAVSGSFPLVAQGAPGALPIAVLVVLLTLALPACSQLPTMNLQDRSC